MVIQKFQKQVSVTHTFTIVQLIIGLFFALLGVAIIYPVIFWLAIALAFSTIGYIGSVILNDAFSHSSYD
jgi:ABC-type transport system involved in multi-copper enzyme maturation permease subunit